MNIYSMGTSVLLENTPLVKIHTKLHPGLEWRIFHILSSEDIDVTDIKFVSLIVPKFVGVSSNHLRVFFQSLR